MSREDNVEITDTKTTLAPITAVAGLFRHGKNLGRYRIFASFDTKLEILVGTTLNHQVWQCIITDKNLAAMSQGLFISGARLRVLINQPKDDAVIIISETAIADTIKFAIKIPILERTVSWHMTKYETTSEQRYQFLQDEFAAYRDQMDRAIAGYKRQLDAAARKHASPLDEFDI